MIESRGEDAPGLLSVTEQTDTYDEANIPDSSHR